MKYTWPVTNYGNADDDGTGDKLRYGIMKKVSEVDLLKIRMNPCSGSKYLDFQLGFRYFSINYLLQTNLLYVSKFDCGIADSGNYFYNLEISCAVSAGVSGTVVMAHAWASHGLKAGKEFIMLDQSNTSGHW